VGNFTIIACIASETIQEIFSATTFKCFKCKLKTFLFATGLVIAISAFDSLSDLMALCTFLLYCIDRFTVNYKLLRVFMAHSVFCLAMSIVVARQRLALALEVQIRSL